jgi:hypothetical protein
MNLVFQVRRTLGHDLDVFRDARGILTRQSAATGVGMSLYARE